MSWRISHISPALWGIPSLWSNRLGTCRHEGPETYCKLLSQKAWPQTPDISRYYESDCETRPKVTSLGEKLTPQEFEASLRQHLMVLYILLWILTISGEFSLEFRLRTFARPLGCQLLAAWPTSRPVWFFVSTCAQGRFCFHLSFLKVVDKVTAWKWEGEVMRSENLERGHQSMQINAT